MLVKIRKEDIERRDMEAFRDKGKVTAVADPRHVENLEDLAENDKKRAEYLDIKKAEVREETPKYKGSEAQKKMGLSEAKKPVDKADAAMLKAYKKMKKNSRAFAVIYAYNQGKEKIFLDEPIVKNSQADINAFVDSFKRNKSDETNVTVDVLYASKMGLFENHLRKQGLIEAVELDDVGDKTVNQVAEENLEESVHKQMNRITDRMLNESVISKSEFNPIEDLRSNVIELPTGDIKYIDYKDGKLIAGDITNAGIMSDVEIEYDFDKTVDGNVEDLYNELIAKYGDSIEW